MGPNLQNIFRLVLRLS